MNHMKKSVTELQAELESIIAWFESDEVDIDKAEEQYKYGLELADELKKRLEETKNNITKLKQTAIVYFKFPFSSFSDINFS